MATSIVLLTLPGYAGCDFFLAPYEKKILTA